MQICKCMQLANTIIVHVPCLTSRISVDSKIVYTEPAQRSVGWIAISLGHITGHEQSSVAFPATFMLENPMSASTYIGDGVLICPCNKN